MKTSPPEQKKTASASLLVGAYCRVSTDEQANVVEGSLDNQQHRMRSFIDIKNMQEAGWGKLVEIYIDDGYSAKDTNRPAYQRMMKDLVRGKINTVMVTELSRLSRSIPDFCDFHKVLDTHEGKFLSIKEQFDTSTPAGRMMLFNMINLAQFEREQTSERVAINCHSRSLRGLLSGGPVILGFDKLVGNTTTFTVNELEADQVRKLFSLFLEHGTLGRTIPVLESLGIKPKARSNKRNRLVKDGRWTVDSLSFVLQNKAYIGLKEVNKANKEKDQSRLKAWQRYTVVKASWPAIVNEETFKHVENVIRENKMRERARLDTSEARVFLASQICKCGQCGRPFVGQSAHGRNKVHRYYAHSAKRGDVIACARKRINADELEARIGEYLCEILLRAGYFDKIGGNVRKIITIKPEILRAEKNRLSLEIQKMVLAIKNTFRIQAELDPESEAIRTTAKELEELSRNKRTLEVELEKIKAKENQEADLDDAIDDLKTRLEAFRRGWKKSSAVAKKALLKDVLYGILVNPKGLSIQFRLKHGLNSDVTSIEVPMTEESSADVIELNKRRQQPPVGTDAASGFDNLGVSGSSILVNGRECRARTDDIHLVRVALYQLS